jgi:hypothetical protein
MQMNRQWMYGSRVSSEFIRGLQGFLRMADANKRNGFYVCPCSVCKNQKKLLFLKNPSRAAASARFHAQLQFLDQARRKRGYNRRQ